MKFLFWLGLVIGAAVAAARLERRFRRRQPTASVPRSFEPQWRIKHRQIATGWVDHADPEERVGDVAGKTDSYWDTAAQSESRSDRQELTPPSDSAEIDADLTGALEGPLGSGLTIDTDADGLSDARTVTWDLDAEGDSAYARSDPDSQSFDGIDEGPWDPFGEVADSPPAPIVLSAPPSAVPRFPSQTSDPVKTMSLDEAVRKALGLEVRLGAMGIEAPPLKLGRNDIVRVVISRDALAQDVVTRLVVNSQVSSVEVLKTSAVMFVNLSGPMFDVTRLNPPDGEQLVADTAVWEFSVVPKASGTQSMTVSASMRIPIPEHGERTVSVPSLEMQFKVDVDRLYAGRSFVRRNWQWIGSSIVAAAAVVVSIIWH